MAHVMLYFVFISLVKINYEIAHPCEFRLFQRADCKEIISKKTSKNFNQKEVHLKCFIRTQEFCVSPHGTNNHDIVQAYFFTDFFSLPANGFPGFLSLGQNP